MLKPPVIEEVLANACVGISTLKANPAAVIAEAQNRQVAILNRNRPVAYVVSPSVWEAVMDMLEEREDAGLLDARLDALASALPVKLEDLV
ncbi:MAG: type II toxin-antitoxin system prevent-host-death family antitoxin [Novosphingobium sp.]|nr:type II toxin-antitoxin system prevent-host-death family antitoxin [Novosphingobium sp.]